MPNLTLKERKATGSHYTPKILANFVASQIVQSWNKNTNRIKIFDPAVGDGELLLALIDQLHKIEFYNFDIYGFDTNQNAINLALSRITSKYKDINVTLKCRDFLMFILDNYGIKNSINLDLFNQTSNDKFDLIISNPPYVRTQVMGSERAQRLSHQFGLTGRVDLYFAFIKGIAQVLSKDGVAGIIVSNRFMLTKSGSSVRQFILNNFNLLHVWDFGDTKLFEAAVLPSVLLVKLKNSNHKNDNIKFTSIYSIEERIPRHKSINIIDALRYEGVVENIDGRIFNVSHGLLDNGNKLKGVWRMSTSSTDTWLKIVNKHTYCTFGDISNIRVGVKTNADKIFIRSDWESLPEDQKPEPELLKFLTTHQIAQRYKAKKAEKNKKILYPHLNINGKRTVINLEDFPKALNYFNNYKNILEKRKYLIDAGRKWYEIWVPQNPELWKFPKIILWDIAKEPTFWMDMEGSVVNGDCYWFACTNSSSLNLFWLALAVGNSSFIMSFYDHKFHNKLYAGRRRFMTQYVEKFPSPDPNTNLSKQIIYLSKKIYKSTDSLENRKLEEEVNNLILKSFGLDAEEISW